MRILWFSAFVAMGLSALLALVWKPAPLEEQLIHLQLSDRLPQYADELRREPLELQALFVDYADDPVLVVKARLAMQRYPHMAKPILELYGSETVFQDVLRDYGEHVVPPIYYHLTTDIKTIAAQRRAEAFVGSVRDKWRRFWGAEGEEGGSPSESAGGITAEERGWYAVVFIQEEGHDFLGQFVVGANGRVSRVQTERVLEALNSFFAGGVRRLEAKMRRDEPVGLGDAGWAAVDLAVGVSALKVLRLGRSTAAGTRSMSFSERSAALGSSLLRGSSIGLRVAKYGAPLALGYIAVRHPSILNSLFREAAAFLGVPVFVVQAFGWALVLLPFILIGQALLRPLAFVLIGLGKALRWSEARIRGAGAVSVGRPGDAVPAIPRTTD